jgi:hypothetical protein
MYQVITERSTYEIDPTNKVFRRIPSKGDFLVKDLEWTPYIHVHHEDIGAPMIIEWSLNAVRKFRTTSPVLNVDLLEEEDYE